MSNAEEMKKDGIPIEDETENVGAEESAEESTEETVEEQTEDVEGEATSEEPASEEVTGETASGEEDDPWQTKYIRLMADFQNYKKRTAKEISDIRSSASEKVMTKILDVLDNFERAFEQGTTDEKYAEGVENIFQQLIKVLEDSGLTEMEVVGQEFDPNFHNAAVMEETDEFESGKISGVIQKGYSLNGKVIRPPMVKVAK